MTFPAAIIGVILSTLIGAAYHLLRGGGLGRLVLFIVLGWIGFWAGQFLAPQTGWVFGSLGTLHLGLAALLSLLLLLIGDWLSRVETP